MRSGCVDGHFRDAPGYPKVLEAGVMMYVLQDGHPRMKRPWIHYFWYLAITSGISACSVSVRRPNLGPHWPAALPNFPPEPLLVQASKHSTTCIYEASQEEALHYHCAYTLAGSDRFALHG